MRPDFETLVKTPILVQPEAGAAKTGDGLRRNRRIPARARARFLRVVRGPGPASSVRRSGRARCYDGDGAEFWTFQRMDKSVLR